VTTDIAPFLRVPDFERLQLRDEICFGLAGDVRRTRNLGKTVYAVTGRAELASL
jgi:hypothetical protein